MDAASTVNRAYRYKIDPGPAVLPGLHSHIGAKRFVHNTLLGEIKANLDECAARKAAGEELSKNDYLGRSHYDLQKLWYEKRDELAPWYGVNGSSAYNYTLLHLSRAFKNWSDGVARFPTFKKRSQGGSFTIARAAAKLVDSHHLSLSRIGDIKTYESMRKLHRHLERGSGRIISVTVSQKAGQWYVSFAVEVTKQLPTTRAPERVIGIDVGLSTLYTGATPDGTHVLSVANPRNYVKRQGRLARAQRQASRKQGPAGKPPSNRWKRANKRVQKIHTETKNARLNLIHQITTDLAKHYDLIVVEDLNIAGLARNKRLAKHILDASWAEFIRQLEYKCAWYGARLVKADRYYASSKTCSSCETVKTKLDLATRVYECDHCGLIIDRDVNAAINLARWAGSLGDVLQEKEPTSAGTHSVAGRGGKVRPKQAKSAAKAHPNEASTVVST